MQTMIVLDIEEFKSFLNSVESLLHCITSLKDADAKKIKVAVEKDCAYFTRVVEQVEEQ